jgi:hypothetical protein
MTEPKAPKPPAPSPNVDRRFAKDVAKQLDRRRMRRKLLIWALVVAALVVAALYLTCGRGWGLGGKGKGEGSGPGSGEGSVSPLMSVVDAGPRQCEVRVAASGITVDGKPATVAEAVTACKTGMPAHVFVTGGARQGDWVELKAALDGAKIKILLTEPEGGENGNSGNSGNNGSGGGGSGS